MVKHGVVIVTEFIHFFQVLLEDDGAGVQTAKWGDQLLEEAYTTDVGGKTAKVIKIEKTTALAFQILKDAIYNIKSIGDSLQGKSVDEVFHVVDLIERFHIPELMEPAKEHLANFPITEDTVLEVAEEAMEYTHLFEAESQHLLNNCAQFLVPKLQDTKSMKSFGGEQYSSTRREQKLRGL